MPVNITQHEEILKKIKDFDPNTNADGPIVATRYQSISPRILWILRETDGEGNWDLREFLAQDKNLFSYSKWHATFGLLAKVSMGLINDLSTEDIQQLNARNATDALRDIAIININKRGGGSRVNWKKYSQNAKDFSGFIKMQIKALDPEIIIAAGTINFLPDMYRPNSKSFNHNFDSIKLNSGQRIIKTYHTAQTTITHHEFYYRVITSLRKTGWNPRKMTNHAR